MISCLAEVQQLEMEFVREEKGKAGTGTWKHGNKLSPNLIWQGNAVGKMPS